MAVMALEVMATGAIVAEGTAVVMVVAALAAAAIEVGLFDTTGLAWSGCRTADSSQFGCA